MAEESSGEGRLKMLRHECPGPDRRTPNTPEEVECPECGEQIEIWAHDKKAKCTACAKEFTREEL